MGKDIQEETKTKAMEVYRYILQYTQANLYPPTIREICAGTGIKSTSMVPRYLVTLAQLGLIDNGGESKPRAIKLKGYKLVKESK